jgi:hypothetical protein
MDRDVPDRFLVAFSFAVEQRDLVRSLAKAVEHVLGDNTVFLDEWFEFYIAGHDADKKLQDIYGKRTELVVECVSKEYGEKLWAQAEHETIRVLSMQARTSKSRNERLRVLPLRVGDGDVEGIPANAIVPDIRNKPPEEVAADIVQRLKLVLRRVYLAQCDSTEKDRREHLKAFLEDKGWSVLPTSDYSPNQYNFRLREDLKNSLAFVQLLEPAPWKPVPFDRIQNETAVAMKLQRFRFRSSDIDLEKVDTAHRKFLTAADVIQSGFEDFKSFLEEKLKILQQKPDQPNRQTGEDDNPPLVRVVIRSPNPDPLWEKVYHWIYEQEHIHPYQLADDESLEEKHLAEPCQGFLVVCDSAALEDGPHSPRKYMEQCRQIQLKEKNPAHMPPVGLVYWPPPDASWPKLLRSMPLKLHQILGDKPDDLGKFFAEVRKVSQ